MEDVWQALVEGHNEVMDALHINVTDIMAAPGVFKSVAAFRDAIAWDEPFFVFVLAFHVIVGSVAMNFMLHGSANAVVALFAVLAASVYGAEYVNDFGKQHYERLFPLHGTNYFDDNGIFIGAIFSAPLLFWAFLLQLRLLGSVAKMMTTIKRHQAREHARQIGQGAIAAGSASPASPKNQKNTNSKRKA
jgi:hypothetical protein